YDLARIEAVLEHAERASDLATRLGTSRAEGAIASFAARALAALDRRDEARVRLGEAVKAARETARGTQGGIVLGAVVLLARGHTAREAAVAEAADQFGKGATSHSQWRFCRDAIDAALGAGEPKLAMRYVALLDESTRNEGQPWCDFVIARGRAL